MGSNERLASIRSFSGWSGATLLLGQALAARMIVFERVAVNGDTGLYIYDALQILWGNHMFVDFPGRSPVVEYILAGTLWLSPFENMVTTRGMMIVVGLIAGIAVYLLGREIAGDRAGLLAMAIYLLTPFSLTWGIWMKTEIFIAVFGTTAMFLGVKAMDRPDPPVYYPIGVGVLFALALLSRRVAFVLIAALVLYTFWYRHRRRSFTLRSTLKQGTIAAVSGIVSLLVLLYLMAGNLGLTWVFFDMYFIDLFRSGGFGSHGYLPLFGEGYVSHQYATVGPESWFQTLCQKCGQRTILVFIRVILATLVALLPLLIWLKAYIEKSPIEWFRFFVPAMLVTQALGGLTLLLLSGTLTNPKAISLIVFASGVSFVWYVDTPDWDTLVSPRVGLILLTPTLMAIAYLYRDRILYPTYFQDFYPYVALLGGIAIDRTWAVIGPVARPSISARWVRKVGAVILLLAFYSSAITAYPYIGDAPSERFANWYTVERVEAYGWDADQRLEGDEMIFVANPLYAVDSDHRIVANLSRRYYLFEGWPNSSVTDRLGDDIVTTLRSDRVPMAVMTSELQEVLSAHQGVNETFHEEFCPVDDPLYKWGEHKELWVKKDDPDMPDCGSTVERSDFVMDQVS